MQRRVFGSVGADGIVATSLIVATALPALQIDLPTAELAVSTRSLAICACAAFFGPWVTFVASATWIGLGALGLPVFQDLEGGMEVVRGPSRGYLVGLLTAPLWWLWAPARHGSWPVRALVAMLAHAWILICGGAGLLTLGLSAADAWTRGMEPFLVGGAIKSMLTGWVPPRGGPLRSKTPKKRRPRSD